MEAMIELIFVLLLLMVILVAIARRTWIPYPIFLVIGGLLISMVPSLPVIEIEPEIVFVLFLPPILSSAGYFTPIRDFRANLRTILLLAIGLVLFTIAIVALVAYTLIPALPLAAAFALGAIVAPPDAIAATSIAQKLKLPRRITTILEGESLLNDASALVAYQVAITAGLTGTFSFGEAAGNFVLTALGGIAIGLAISWFMCLLLARINDTPVEVILTFLGSFLSYLVAERAHVSGVLAAVFAGLYLGRYSPRVLSPRTRVTGESTWEIIIFLLNGLVFILIGFQLPAVLERLHDAPLTTLIGYALVISLATIVSRFLWIFPTTYLPKWFNSTFQAVNFAPTWQGVTVVSWAGMRGIVSLAAALALPEAFPDRDLIVFLTFGVILATLVGQGLTLPGLIRWLRVVDDGGGAREEVKARWVAAKAGLERLDQLSAEEWLADHEADHVREHYTARAERFRVRYLESDDGVPEERAAAQTRLEYALMDAELEALFDLRDRGIINDEALRRMQRELDFERLRIGEDGDGLR